MGLEWILKQYKFTAFKMNKYTITTFTKSGLQPNVSNQLNNVRGVLRIIPNQGEQIIAGNFTIDGQRGYPLGDAPYPLARHRSLTYLEEQASNVYTFKTPTSFDINGNAIAWTDFNSAIENIKLTERYNQTSNFPIFIVVEVNFTQAFKTANIGSNISINLDFDLK